jgi:hypothetical protein
MSVSKGDMKMAEESKVTLKVGLIAAGAAALIMFMLNTLWVHNGQINVLQTNQIMVMKNLDKVDAAMCKIDEKLTSIDIKLAFMGGKQETHTRISKDNNLILKKNGK